MGAILNVGGVFLYALLEWHSFKSTQDWEFAALITATFMPALLVGTVLVIVGSFFSIDDDCPWPGQEFGASSVGSQAAISFSLLASIGNVHGWTFAFLFPAFAGFLTGVVLLSKSRRRGARINTSIH
jgi:hypothetical protein